MVANVKGVVRGSYDGKRRDDDTYIRRSGGCMIFLVISEMIYHSDVSFGVFAQ